MRRALLLPLLAGLLAACGGGAEDDPPLSASDQRWAVEAGVVVGELTEALRHVANAGVDRATLGRPSLLYEALLGYTYLGGCTEVVTNLGEPGVRWRELRGQLVSTCEPFERASRLFTQAVRLRNVTLLAQAARTALSREGVVKSVAEQLARVPRP